MYGTGDVVLGTTRGFRARIAGMFKKSKISAVEELEGVYSELNGTKKAYVGINHIFGRVDERATNISQTMTHIPARRDLITVLKRHL